MKTDPQKLVHKGATAIRRLHRDYGKLETSPEALARDVLIACGVLKKREYERALWQHHGPPKGCDVAYLKGSGILEIRCNVCQRPIIGVRVAKEGAVFPSPP